MMRRPAKLTRQALEHYAAHAHWNRLERYFTQEDAPRDHYVADGVTHGWTVAETALDQLDG